MVSYSLGYFLTRPQVYGAPINKLLYALEHLAGLILKLFLHCIIFNLMKAKLWTMCIYFHIINHHMTAIDEELYIYWDLN